MAIPLGTIAQGLSLVTSLVGSKGPSSTALQMEMINQLREINDTLVGQSKILANIDKSIRDLPAQSHIFNTKNEITKIERRTDAVFKNFSPTHGNVENPQKHYEELISLFHDLTNQLHNLVGSVRFTQNIDFWLADLSYPIISVTTNLKLVSDILIFPARLIQIMNKDRIRLVQEFSPEPAISSEEYQTTYLQIEELLSEITDSYRAPFMEKLTADILEFADDGSTLPGELTFSGHGYRQDRYWVSVSSPAAIGQHVNRKTWYTHGISFKRQITVASPLGPVDMETPTPEITRGITHNGDVARKTYREKFRQLDVKHKASRGDHMNEKRIDASRLRQFEREQAQTIRTDPDGYARRLGYQNLPQREKNRVLSQIYYISDVFMKIERSDREHFQNESKFNEHLNNSIDHLSIYIYLSGVFGIFDEICSQVNERVSVWVSGNIPPPQRQEFKLTTQSILP